MQINDQINTVLNRYEAFKRGDYVAAANPLPSELTKAQDDLSLIDLEESQPSTNATNTTASEIDVLASVFGPSTASVTPTPAGSQQLALAHLGHMPSSSTTAFGVGVSGKWQSGSSFQKLP